MTPDQITQLRKLLKKAITCSVLPGAIIMEAEVYHQILALLPCETCDDTGQGVLPRENTPGVDWEPCPDCKS